MSSTARFIAVMYPTRGSGEVVLLYSAMNSLNAASSGESCIRLDVTLSILSTVFGPAIFPCIVLIAAPKLPR